MLAAGRRRGTRPPRRPSCASSSWPRHRACCRSSGTLAHSSSSASTPGSVLPSSSSRDAPPPVDSQSTSSARPNCGQRGDRVAAADHGRRPAPRRSPRRPPSCRRRTARARRPPSARSRRRCRRPRSRRRRRAAVRGPMSRPIQPSGTSTPVELAASASASKRSASTRSTGSRSSQPEPSALLERLGRQLDALLLDQRVADRDPLGAEEAEAHRAADQDPVGDLEEAVDHPELVADLGAAEDDDQRALRVGSSTAVSSVTSRSSRSPA